MILKQSASSAGIYSGYPRALATIILSELACRYARFAGRSKKRGLNPLPNQGGDYDGKRLRGFI
jgi:hypothetical protein